MGGAGGAQGGVWRKAGARQCLGGSRECSGSPQQGATAATLTAATFHVAGKFQALLAFLRARLCSPHSPEAASDRCNAAKTVLRAQLRRPTLCACKEVEARLLRPQLRQWLIPAVAAAAAAVRRSRRHPRRTPLPRPPLAPMQRAWLTSRQRLSASRGTPRSRR